MRVLVVDDDFINRKLLIKMLSSYGVCDVAVNGQEAVEAFQLALIDGQPYDLICLDIMMPEMDGNKALEKIRKIENEKGIRGLDGVKVIMTTAVDSSRSIMGAFKTGCEAYIVKPITREKLYKELEKLNLLESNIL